MVKHSKWLMLAAVAAALAVVAGGALYAAHAQVGTPMYVAEVSVIAFHGGFKAPRFTSARVLILDQGGQPVSGATVTGRFTGCGNNYSGSETTDQDGVAIIRGRRRQCGCVHTFTVTDVTKSGWDYIPPDPPDSASACLCGDCS